MPLDGSAWPVYPPPDAAASQQALLREQRRRLADDRECGTLAPGEQAAPFIRPAGDAQRRVVPFRPPADLFPQRGTAPDAPATPYGIDALTAAMHRLAAVNEKLYQQQRVQQRIRLLQIMGDPNLPPTYFPPVIAGNVIAAFGAAYSILFTNDRKFPVGFDVLMIWATAGASIRLSLSPSENGWYADIANGGPAGGYGSGRIWLYPQQSVWIRDIGAGLVPPASAMVAADLIHRRVCDPNDYLQDPQWVQDVGFTMGVKP